jgi:hypothetical protein
MSTVINDLVAATKRHPSLIRSTLRRNGMGKPYTDTPTIRNRAVEILVAHGWPEAEGARQGGEAGAPPRKRTSVGAEAARGQHLVFIEKEIIARHQAELICADIKSRNRKGVDVQEAYALLLDAMNRQQQR